MFMIVNRVGQAEAGANNAAEECTGAGRAGAAAEVHSEGKVRAAARSCSGIIEPSAGRIAAQLQPMNVQALVFTPAWLLAIHLRQAHASLVDAHA